MNIRHLVALIMDSERENPFFRSPIGDSPQHILDIGTGRGTWAMYVCYLVMLLIDMLPTDYIK